MRRAQVCDIDHTTPYPYGPTHPSNTKLYCRTHHLLKTFYAGFGWKEQQFPDGTITWTAPTGHTYSTQSHGGTLFPALAQPTGDLGDITVPDESPHRDVMMPTRRQTREQDRHDRITKERRQRKELDAKKSGNSGHGAPPTKNHHRSRAAHLSARRPTCPDCSARRRQGTTAPSSAIRRRRLRGADRRCAR